MQGELSESTFIISNEEWLDENQQIVLNEGIPMQLFYDSLEVKDCKQYECLLCLEVVWKPVECSNCRKNMCSNCCKNYIKDNCPSCRNQFIPQKTHPIVYSGLSSSRFRCIFSREYGCKQLVPYEQFEIHANSCIYRKPNRKDIKSIEIKDYKIMQDGNFQKKYISYQIEITLFCNETFIINKRYRDFCSLHQSLYSDQEIFGRILPHMPQKFFDFYSLVGYSPSNLNDILQRQVSLEAYLTLLASNPLFSQREVFKKFLSQNEIAQIDLEEQNPQSGILKDFKDRLKNLLKNKDTSIEFLSQKFSQMRIRDIKLDSIILEENEQLCNEYKPSVEAVFDNLVKIICDCNQIVSSNTSKDPSTTEKKSSHFSTMELLDSEFKTIIKNEMEEAKVTKQKLLVLLKKIAMCISRLSGFQDGLNQLKQLSIDYTLALELKLKASAKQPPDLDDKISSYNQQIEILKKNLELDSNQLKEEITQNIPEFINEFQSICSSTHSPETAYYKQIAQKYEQKDDSLFFKINDVLQKVFNDD